MGCIWLLDPLIIRSFVDPEMHGGCALQLHADEIILEAKMSALVMPVLNTAGIGAQKNFCVIFSYSGRT